MFGRAVPGLLPLVTMRLPTGGRPKGGHETKVARPCWGGPRARAKDRSRVGYVLRSPFAAVTNVLPPQPREPAREAER